MEQVLGQHPQLIFSNNRKWRLRLPCSYPGLQNVYFKNIKKNAEYNTGQVSDLSEKLEQAESSLGRAALVAPYTSSGGVSSASEDRRSEDRLAKAARDATKTSIEALHGLLAQVIKDRLFNQVRPRPS